MSLTFLSNVLKLTEKKSEVLNNNVELIEYFE